MDEISNKADKIDDVNARIDGLVVRELVVRAETLEVMVKRTKNLNEVKACLELDRPHGEVCRRIGHLLRSIFR